MMGNPKAVSIRLLAIFLCLNSCATLDVWERWDSQERGRYFGLSWTAPDSIVEKYRSLAYRESRDSLYHRYWQTIDASGQALAEHEKRLREAEELFGGTFFYWDDRSRWWVRRGKPEIRLTYHARPHALEAQRLVGARIVKEQPWEIWEYPGSGWAVDFIKVGDYFREVWSHSLDRRHPVAYFCEWGGDDRFLADTVGRRILPLGCSQARFRADSAQMVRWEIYWWLPLSEVRDSVYRMWLSVGREDKPYLEQTLALKVAGRDTNLPEPFVFGQKNLILPPGRYRAELRLMSREDRDCYAGMLSAELLDYRPRAQEASDIQMAVLQDTTPMAPQFSKGAYRRVVPFPGQAIRRFQPFYIYYEIYHLATAGGRHWLRIGQQIYSTDNQGRQKECLINTDPVESNDAGDTYRGCQKIHLLSENLPGGRYILRINAEDRISGRNTTLTMEFLLGGELVLNKERAGRQGMMEIDFKNR